MDFNKIMLAVIAILLVIIAALLVMNELTKPKTCSQLGGFDCTENSECIGKILPASDSPNCCSIVCKATTKSGSAVSEKQN